jgi:D-alanine-D-alanine ligase
MVHVAVLKGGISSEREVSLVSGTVVAKGLRAKGYEVTEIDAGRDIASVLTALKPDVVFNALHGSWGEDGCVQGVLETLGIPYTHSGVLASALAMDKSKARSVLMAAGLHMADGLVMNRFAVAKAHPMPVPYVVKPISEGSSVGVFIVHDGANRPPEELAAPDWTYGEDVLVERFIPGLELAVAVLGDRALMVTEIEPTTAFYDYESKYSDGGSRHILPARISEEVAERLKEMALQAHRALGCRGMTRADFRYDSVKDEAVLLEVNTQPGMTPASLAPEQAAHCGMGFEDLVAWITEDARGRGTEAG